MEQLLDENRLWWGRGLDNFPRLKSFLAEVQEGVVPATVWLRTEAGDNQEAAREIRALFRDQYGVFDTPKPSRLIRRMLQLSTESSDEELVLDFFAGSGTAAHAVMKSNAEDGGNRRFILVQIPEPTDGAFRTISAITRERVRRAGKVIADERAGKLDLDGHGPLDLGFRAYSLTTSNFVPWKGGGYFTRYTH